MMLESKGAGGVRPCDPRAISGGLFFVKSQVGRSSAGMGEKNLADGMPSTIGRYKVLEGIGFGAQGAVYRAFDPLIKRTPAIKTIRLDIPPPSPPSPSFLERFFHPARLSGPL